MNEEEKMYVPHFKAALAEVGLKEDVIEVFMDSPKVSEMIGDAWRLHVELSDAKPFFRGKLRVIIQEGMFQRDTAPTEPSPAPFPTTKSREPVKKLHVTTVKGLDGKKKFR